MGLTPVVKNHSSFTYKWQEDHQFSEAKGIIRLEQLAGNDENAEEYGKLASHLARVRFERLNRIDPLIKKWLRDAIKVDSKDKNVQYIQLRSFFNEIKQLTVPTSFPIIRETDHGIAKKRAAEQYANIAKSFLHDVNLIREKEHELDRGTMQLDRFFYEHILDQLEEQFTLILNVAAEFVETGSTLYHPKNELNHLNEATTEIDSLAEKWDELLKDHHLKKEVSSALDELDQMVGLSDVKQRIKSMYQYLRYEQARLSEGFRTKDELGLHLVLTGNPGTGKTHLARLFAKIYYEMGLVEHESVFEVDRTDLVGAFVGQTEEKTIQAIEKAAGGVLFIDEAYSLRREDASGNDYGQTVVDTLVSALTSETYAGTFVLIMAGYPEEMRSFLRTNPGLRSRIPEQNFIHIHNYSIDELMQIAQLIADENDYILTEDAEIELRKQIERMQVDESFGNGRAVKNILLQAVFAKGAKANLKNTTNTDFILLKGEDFKINQSEQTELALEQIDGLVGLHEIKDEMKAILSYINIQQKRREHHLPTVPVQLHAIFSGNPGTGKTTVARLYAKALKEIGYLKRGHLVEVSRVDLVAGYVGQTAQKTKEKIHDALGGVLFIDEAYSLLSSNRNDFGKEAIQALMQAMTDYEENLVVIMAGYEHELETVLQTNRGLRSRFKKHFRFKDYSKEQIFAILQSRLIAFDYQLTKDAEEQLREWIGIHDGNGRYALQLFDELVQIQSMRLMNEMVTTQQLQMIELDDILQLIKRDK